MTDAAHGHHLCKLVTHVSERELALCDVGHHLLGLLGSHRLINFREQALQITQAQEAADEALGFEGFKVFKVLTCTYEDDWTLCRCNSREGSTTFCVAVELSDNNLTDFDCVMERLCLSVTGLSDTTIHDENGGVWFDCRLYLQHFVE